MAHDTELLMSATVTILAMLLYLYMGLNVSAMRDKHDVKPPAVTGDPEFERAFRVHQNTLEALPIFLVSLWLAAIYFQPARWLPSAVALVWIAGRLIYMRGYIAAADKRGTGLRIQAFAMALNLALSVAGIAISRSA